MATHRRHEELVHRPLGGPEQVAHLGGIEPPPACRQGELLLERRTEAKEPLDGLAE